MKQSDHLTDDSEQSQESLEPPSLHDRAELADVHRHASGLINALHEIPDGALVGEIVANALKLLRDRTNHADIKLINKSFKELRYALKIFAPYRETHKVSIFGSARTMPDHPDYEQAAAFGRAMAGKGWMVITGAGGGIMEAGHGGNAERSFGLAIRLPFEQKTNPVIADDPKLINFKYFFTRKLIFVRFSNAIALFPGGFGTMDEGFEVLTLVQTGKSAPLPIVMVDAPGGDYWSNWQEYVKKHLLTRGLVGENDLQLYTITDNAETAADVICRFYRNYHSIRYTRDDVVMRLQRPLSPEMLESIQKDFADIVVRGGFRIGAALPVERDEPAIAHLPRLIFAFNRRDHARLHMLIDRLNTI